MPRRYRMAAHGAAEIGNMFSVNLCLKEDSTVRLYSLRQSGDTTVRILPGRNPDDPIRPDFFRLSDQVDDFGDWIRSYPAVRNVGLTKQATFILCDPADPSQDPSLSPYVVLRTRLRRGLYQSVPGFNPAWEKLFESTEKQRAALSAPTYLYFVQAFIFALNGEPFNMMNNRNRPIGLGEGDPLPVLQLTKTAGEALKAKCNERSITTGEFLIPDLVSFDKGLFVTFVPMKQSYGVKFSKEYMGITPQIPEAVGMEKIRLFDDIIRVMSYEEQAELLSTLFPSDVLEFGWQDFPEYRKFIKKGTTTVFMAETPSQVVQQEPSVVSGFEAALSESTSETRSDSDLVVSENEKEVSSEDKTDEVVENVVENVMDFMNKFKSMPEEERMKLVRELFGTE